MAFLELVAVEFDEPDADEQHVDWDQGGILEDEVPDLNKHPPLKIPGVHLIEILIQDLQIPNPPSTHLTPKLRTLDPQNPPDNLHLKPNLPLQLNLALKPQHGMQAIEPAELGDAVVGAHVV